MTIEFHYILSRSEGDEAASLNIARGFLELSRTGRRGYCFRIPFGAQGEGMQFDWISAKMQRAVFHEIAGLLECGLTLPSTGRTSTRLRGTAHERIIASLQLTTATGRSVSVRIWTESGMDVIRLSFAGVDDVHENYSEVFVDLAPCEARRFLQVLRLSLAAADRFDAGMTGSGKQHGRCEAEAAS